MTYERLNLIIVSNLSYSIESFNAALQKIRNYNKNSDEFLKKFPPYNLEIFKKNKNYKNIYKNRFMIDKKLQLEFGVGVMNSILIFHFDGESSFFREFCQKVVTEAFNYGEFQKLEKSSFFYSFDKIVKKGGFFVEIGELWAKKVFCE